MEEQKEKKENWSKINDFSFPLCLSFIGCLWLQNKGQGPAGCEFLRWATNHLPLYQVNVFSCKFCALLRTNEVSNKINGLKPSNLGKDLFDKWLIQQLWLRKSYHIYLDKQAKSLSLVFKSLNKGVIYFGLVFSDMISLRESICVMKLLFSIFLSQSSFYACTCQELPSMGAVMVIILAKHLLVTPPSLFFFAISHYYNYTQALTLFIL